MVHTRVILAVVLDDLFERFSTEVRIHIDEVLLVDMFFLFDRSGSGENRRLKCVVLF